MFRVSPSPLSSRRSLNDVAPKQALMTIWIMWGALLMGQLVFLGFVAFQVSQAGAVPHPEPILFTVDMIMFVTIVPVTFLVRRVVQGRARRVDGTIPAAAYTTGNIIFWAGCEGVSFFGMIVAMLNGSLWPTIVIVAAAMGLQVISFPRSAALQAPNDTFKIE